MTCKPKEGHLKGQEYLQGCFWGASVSLGQGGVRGFGFRCRR